MGLFGEKKLKIKESEFQQMQKDYAEVQQQLFDVQVVLAEISEVNATASGNPYKEYDTAIAELGRKYEGRADWGCYQTRSIVDVRSAFTIGNGITAVETDPSTTKSVSKKGQFQAELDFIESFIQHNDLDEEGAQEFAKEAELEGRILFKLIPNKEKQQIDLRFISYNEHHYKVISAKDDYKTYESVEYKVKNTSDEVKLKKQEFVYKKFAGRADKVNDVMPKVATILRNLEDLDKALKDMRAINNLYASPTPHFNCEDATSAQNLWNKLKEINWKIGKFLVTSKTQFTLVGAPQGGMEAIDKEVISLVKIISGVTGIPVHFLGLPDLMSNRSTSTDMFEMIIASTNKERVTWIGTYEEVFRKAMEMYNKEFKKNLNPDGVSCDIPRITAAKLKELVEVWLPLFQNNVVDLDFMLSMIPDADPDGIKENLKKAAQEMADLFRENLNNEPDDTDTGSAGGGQ